MIHTKNKNGAGKPARRTVRIPTKKRRPPKKKTEIVCFDRNVIHRTVEGFCVSCLQCEETGCCNKK
jgi:hypothetical protein